MAKPLVIITLTAIVAGGFGFFTALYWQKTKYAELQEQFEDRAVMAVQAHFSVAHHLDHGDHKGARELTDTYLYQSLSIVPQGQGSIESAEWHRAKVKSLNGVSQLWKIHPPFQNAEWRSSSAEWVPEWEAGLRKIMSLLAWAESECRAHPEYQCKMSSPK